MYELNNFFQFSNTAPNWITDGGGTQCTAKGSVLPGILH